MFVKVLSDSESDSEKRVEKVLSRGTENVIAVPKLEIPFSTQRVLSKIEEAQLCRAKKDIDMQLEDILSNVRRTLNRYSLEQHLPQLRKNLPVDYNKKWRSNVLEKISTFSQSLDLREKTLAQVLAWLEEWSAILSEITTINNEERNCWAAQMEILPMTLKVVESNVKLLTKISMSLFEDKKRQKKKLKSRGTLWKPWKDRVIKRPATAHALRPDQMISDEFITNVKVSEIQDMLQELIGTSMFSKMETNAIKYISSTITNLSKALSTVNEELKLNVQSANILIEETVEKEKEISLNIIDDLSEKNEMLLQQLQNAELKYEQLLRSKNSLERQLQVFAATSSKALPKLSPRSSLPVTEADDIDEAMDSILVKEFENVVDEAQRKGTGSPGVKREPAVLQTAQTGVSPDLTKRQHALPGRKQQVSHEGKADSHLQPKTDHHQPQKRKPSEKPSKGETSGSKPSDEKDEQKGEMSKSTYHPEPQALGKQEKDTKSSSEAQTKSTTESKRQHITPIFPSTETKGQSDRSVTSTRMEKLRVESKYPSDRRQISLEAKAEPTTEFKGKEGKSEISGLAEPSRDVQSEKKTGKKYHISPETASTEEKPEERIVLAKPLERFKPRSGISQQDPESIRAQVPPVGKSEQSNLEKFQEDIMAFLKEKIDNIGKPVDEKTMLKEELLLKKGEAKNLEPVKTKLEEYFRKVAETITTILRKYKDTKKEGHIRDKLEQSKRSISFMPELQILRPSPSTRANINAFLLHENVDPVFGNLIQMILTEIEREKEVPVISTSRRDQKSGEYSQGSLSFSGVSFKHQLPEEKNLWEEKTQLRVKEVPQILKPRQEREKRRVQQKWMQMWTDENEKQKQRQKEKEEQQLLKAREHTMKEKRTLLKKGEQMRQGRKEVRLLEVTTRGEQEEKQEVEDYGAILQRQKKAVDKGIIKKKTHGDLETRGSKTTTVSSDSVSSPRLWSMLKDASQLYPRKETDGNLKSFKVLLDEEYPIPVTPPTSMQSSPSEIFPVPGDSPTKWITLTPEQAQAMGMTLTPQQAQAQGITLTPQQAQALGLTLTLQQAQAQRITLTPQQAQSLGITLTPQQAQALGVALTPEEAQAQGITLTPQQAQALGIALTPKEAQAQGITLTPQQAQALGLTLTPQQVQAQGLTLTSQQAQALGIALAPKEAQAQGITLTPQQAQTLGITLTPQQAQSLGITLIPQQAQAQGITLTPQQTQTQGITLTPQQVQTLGINLTPQQVQAQGITLTPQQAQALGLTLTPQRALAQGITLTPQQAQAQALGIAPISEQVQTQEITLALQQAQELGLTHEQAQSLGVFLRDQALQVPVTQEQARELRVPITLENVQQVPKTLNLKQTHAVRVTPSLKQIQATGISLAPGAPLTLRQAQKLGVPITPTLQPGQTLGPPFVSVMPGQVQPMVISLKSKQGLKPRTPFSAEQPSQLWTGPPSERTTHLRIFSVTGQSFKPSSSRIPKQSPALAPSTLRPLVESKSRFPEQSFMSSFSHFSASSAVSKMSSVFGVSSPMKISRSPLTPSPFAPGTSPVMGIASDPEKLLASQSLPASGGQPLILKPSLTPTKPLIPRIPPASGQIPSLPAGQHLVSGVSSLPEELLGSRPSTSPEQSQVSQPTPWRPSTLQQHPASWVVPTPGQPTQLQVDPTSGQTPKLWAPPTPEKLQGDLASFIFEESKEESEIISSLKSESALVPPSASKFQAQEAPFTTKKFQMSDVSDTSEETRMFQDPFAMEQFRTTQPSLTDYTRTQVSKTSYTDEGALPILMQPKESLPSVITQSPKLSQVSLSEWDQKSKFPSTDESCILAPVLATKKTRMIVPASSPQELEEKYFVDVKAQRKNLVLLNQAIKKFGVSSQLLTTARNLITEILHTDTVRLGYLFRKYIAFRLIQNARNNITKRLRAIQDTGKSYDTQNLYTMLSRIDAYQKKVMQVWTEKQKSLEQKRNQCLRTTMDLFSQIREVYKLDLSPPIPLNIDRKQIPASTKLISHPYLELLTKETRKPHAFRKLRQQKDHMEAIWNVDLSTSSYPIIEKQSIHSLWAQLGGYPDIPRLLQLDIHSVFRKSLASIQSHLDCQAKPSAVESDPTHEA